MIRTVPAVLGHARDLLTPALRTWVARLHPEVRRVVEYHLGWIDAAGDPAPSSGGKALRPALAFLGAEAVGEPASQALRGAVAVELVHNFSLLHDDVMDGDTERRHRPTAWSLFGVGPAIVAGDALLTLAHQVFLEGPDSAGLEAASALADATQTMIAGQAEDLAFEGSSRVSFEECLAMSARKTAAILECSASIGAILAGARRDVVGALERYGHHLGIAFQAIDDTFGVWGAPETTGKPAHSDLRQHKRTLPIVAALEAAKGAGRLRTLLERNGEMTERDLGEAAPHLAAVELAPPARAELVELARFVTARDH